MSHDNVMTWKFVIPDGKVHGANMGPTWVLSAPGGSHVGPMDFAIWDVTGLLWEEYTVHQWIPLTKGQ